MKTLCAVAAVLAFTLGASAQNKAVKTGAAAYDDFAEPWRSRFLKAWEKEVSDARTKRATYGGRAATAKDPETRRVNEIIAKSIEKRVELLEENAPPFVGWLKVGDFAVGAFGNPNLIAGKAVQIIDAKTMLVGVEHISTGGGRYSTWAMLKGCPTAGLVDGKTWTDWIPLLGKRLVVVSGTTMYKTVSGGTKTVFVLEPLSFDRFMATPAELAKRNAEEAAKAKEDRAREEAEKKRQQEAAKEAACAAAVRKAEDDGRRMVEAAAKAEKQAAGSLTLVKELIAMNRLDSVRDRLRRIVKQYPETKAAAEARELLKKY